MTQSVYDLYLSTLTACIASASSLTYGKSVLNNDLYCLQFGNPLGKRILIHAGIHAREWCTSFALMHLILSHFTNCDLKNQYFLIPCANPDGLQIASTGISNLPPVYRNFLLAVNDSRDFSLWKANANAVDLNVNFPAKWAQGKHNIHYPASENYVGIHPASEPETSRLMKFTKFVHPNLTISLHSKGEEIYYNFHLSPSQKLHHFAIAKRFASALNYKIVDLQGSTGGYKDWCIQTFKIPSLTIELGSDTLSHPIGLSHLPYLHQKLVSIFPVLESF